MTAATLPLPTLETRLLVVDRARETWADQSIDDLPDHFGPGDLFVVNDAATLPASLPTDFGEARLAGPIDEGWVVLFGAGSWRIPTEERPPPPTFAVGDRFFLAGRSVPVLEVSPVSPTRWPRDSRTDTAPVSSQVRLTPESIWQTKRHVQRSLPRSAAVERTYSSSASVAPSRSCSSNATFPLPARELGSVSVEPSTS